MLGVQENELIITDSILIRPHPCLQKKASAIATAAERLTSDPITVGGYLLVVKALERMKYNRQQEPVTVLPVVDRDQRVIALLRLHDLVDGVLA